MTRADRYADLDWHAQRASDSIMRPRMPHIGDTFATGATQWRIIATFACFSEERFTARNVDNGFQVQTFERVVGKLNQWRAFQQSHAPVFSL